MDNKWEEMYIAAKTVQNERKISKYVEAGTVAAAILSTKNKIYTGVCIDTWLVDINKDGNTWKIKV